MRKFPGKFILCFSFGCSDFGCKSLESFEINHFLLFFFARVHLTDLRGSLFSFANNWNVKSIVLPRFDRGENFEGKFSADIKAKSNVTRKKSKIKNLLRKQVKNVATDKISKERRYK